MAERRVLIWPCDVTGLPALPIANSVGDAVALSNACGDRMMPESVRDISKGADVSSFPDSDFRQHGKLAIIGWMHESQSGTAMTTTIALVAGAIFIPHSNKDSAPSTEKNQRNNQRLEPTVTASDKSEQDIILRAIQFLSSQFPCITMKSPCEECTPCATYKSLQILHVYSHDDQDIHRRSERKDKFKNHRHQVILYNPKEASDWYTRHSRHKQRQNTLYLNGSWETVLILVGQSFHVLRNLNLAMLYLRHNQITNLTGSTNAEAERSRKPKNESCDECRCFNSQETNQRFDTRATKKNSFFIWNESLLLFYWNGDDINHVQQCLKCCNRCTGDIMLRNRNAELRMIGYSAIQLASILGLHVPLISLIKILSLQEPGSNSKAHFKPQLPWNDKSKLYSSAVSTAISLDAALGLLIGIGCMACHKSIVHTITYSWKQYHDSFWDNGLAWLQSNPAGVKMNMALTKQIGTGVRCLLHFHARLVFFLFPTNTSATVLLQSIGAFTIVFGSRFFFALAFDSSRLAVLHVYILSFLFSACHRLELSTLSSLWLLFRGKKRNILRLRSDHLDYDHMQLLLGMLLFSVCLFLFTTILVHHCFFAVVGCVSELMLSGMWLGYMGVESIFHIEKVLWDRQSGYCVSSHLWSGMDVKLHTVSLSELDACWRRLDNPYVDAYFNGSNTINMNTEKSDVPALPPCIRVESIPTVVSKLSFPMTSNASTITKAFLSFFTSRLTRITTFLSSLIFASRCSITLSCMDMTRSLQQSYNSWVAEQSCYR